MRNFPEGPLLTPSEQTFLWFSKPYAFLDGCVSQFGSIFTLEFSKLGKHVFVSEPSMVQAVFSGSPEIFHAGKGNEILRPFLGAHSLLTLDGKGHQEHRKWIGPAFHQGAMKNYHPKLKEAIDAELARWRDDSVVAIYSSMLGIALEVILRVIFSFQDPTELSGLKKEILKFLDLACFSAAASGTDDPLEFGGMARRIVDEGVGRAKAVFLSELQKRKRSQPEHWPSDVLSELLRSSHQQSTPISDEAFAEELFTLVIAGHETTATALAWAFYWIHSDEVVRSRLLEELDGAHASDLETLQRLPYLDAVVKETLRLYPVIPVVSRVLQEEFRLAEFVIPSGTHVVPCIYLTHQREEIFPQPKKFHPERFLEKRYSPYEYYPFGDGVRRCIGMGLGILEMKMILSQTLLCWQLRLSDSASARPVRRTVTLGPAGGVKMHVSRREKK